jgi:two-component system response regulator NreC
VTEEPARTGPLTIVLADDHAVMRSGLRMLLDAEEEFEVVAEAATLQSAFVHVRSHRPTVLVLDINMPGGSTVDAITRLSAISPRTAVVVLSMEHDPLIVRKMLDAGASAYVFKEAAATELVDKIRGAAASRV